MRLRPLYCDQLTRSLPSLETLSADDDVILLAETHEEATYVKHHKKKLVFQFSAMRHFAQELESEGFQVRYITFDDPDNQQTFPKEILRAAKELSAEEIIMTSPSEYRQLQDIQNLKQPIEILDDTRFFTTPNDFITWSENQRGLLMETFYRKMRKETGLLMKADKPVGDVWNLDKENRKTLPKDMPNPKPITFTPDATTKDVIKLVDKHFPDHFGTTDNFHFAVTSTDAKKAFNYFIKNHLKFFGDYQDTMKEGQPFLFHSIISPYINAGLLDPKEACQAAEKAYKNKHAPLNAVEGFIRQILGWREFIRGIYWLHMPDYVTKNELGCKNPLPDFYWTGETKMNCVKQVVQMTQEEAYSHHIQRLMVTGNFALLAHCDPHQVHEWYLAVYADAYEWVELPNTIGMALYADGGIVGTKPYISSGAYINRMSDFCKNCHYNVKEKFGETACPFNSLYWYFILKHQDRFQKNPRMSLPYRNLNKMDKEQIDKIKKQSESFLATLK